MSSHHETYVPSTSAPRTFIDLDLTGQIGYASKDASSSDKYKAALVIASNSSSTKDFLTLLDMLGIDLGEFTRA